MAGKLGAAFIPTPLGRLLAVADQRALHLLEFIDQDEIGEIGEIGESDRVELTSVAAATEPSHRRCRDWDAPSPAVEQVLVADLTA